MKALLDKFNEVSNKLGEVTDDIQMTKLLEEQGELQEKIEACGGWEIEREIEVAMEARAREAEVRRPGSCSRAVPQMKQKSSPSRSRPPSVDRASRGSCSLGISGGSPHSGSRAFFSRLMTAIGRRFGSTRARAFARLAAARVITRARKARARR